VGVKDKDEIMSPVINQPKLYAAGFVTDPVSYAIRTLYYVHDLIGQDKSVTFAIMALEELQEEMRKSGTKDAAEVP
jgi:hypothetical protein